MHSYLIVSKNRQSAIDYAIGECKKRGIDKFDITTLSFEKQVGIEDVRNFLKKLILKPFKSKEKAVILEGYNGITIEAQNALLNLLEEPPLHTFIFVTVSNKELMLPTILSRCKIIDLKDKPSQLSKEETAQYLSILISLSINGVGERLKLAQDMAKNKEEIIPELEKMIMVAREGLIDSVCHSERSEESHKILRRFAPQDDKAIEYFNILISLQRTFTVLKTTNVNPRLVLENQFLNL